MLNIFASQIKKEIDYMLEALGIEDKRNTISHKLSGGMKRKLSVGIALSGGSKIVLLDEPSTGTITALLIVLTALL